MKFVLALALFACIGLSVQAAHKSVGDKSGALCEACTNIAQFIKNAVDNDLPEEEVEKAVQEICNLLSGDLADLCNNKILPLVKKIYEGINQSTPEVICGDLGFC
ncbi:saposin-B-Val-like [Diorhabda sublineata]|uniref:saposin-B-Val-like n=1 Tax=Diorhabda sublineata TaxID=1163346 RepID=UPI0024E15770|nr:saposin-B-Val-like [Diorhabda sublineata]